MSQCSEKLRHRGPDWSGYVVADPGCGEGGVALGHERLAIMDPESGAQPLTSADGKVCA